VGGGAEAQKGDSKVLLAPEAEQEPHLKCLALQPGIHPQLHGACP
jgi:hypothetical protein